MQPRKDARDTRLYRGPKAIAGVCSGIAEYFNADVIIIRIAWILLSFFSAGIAAVVYMVLWVVIPEDPRLNKTVVDVDPVSVQSDKYQNVVDSSCASSASGAERFGVNAGSGHIPPCPPRSASQEGFSGRRDQQLQGTAFRDYRWDGHNPAENAFRPIGKSEKKDTSSVGLAILLGLGLVIFFTACAHASTLFLPGVHFSDFFPMVFVALGVVIVAIPANRWSFAMRICGFMFCVESCLALLPFSLGLVPFEAVGSLSIFALILWVVAGCLVIISLVSPSELIVVALVVVVMVAIILSFVDIGVFERIATLITMNPPHKKSIPLPISVHS